MNNNETKKDLHRKTKLKNIEIKNEFQRRLRKRVDDLNLSQQMLSEMLDKYEDCSSHPKSVQNWYSGKCTPNYETLNRLADILKCDVDYLSGKGNIDDYSYSLKNEKNFSGLSSKALEHIKNLSQDKRDVLEQIIMNCDDVLDDIVKYNNLQKDVDLEEKSATRSIDSMPIYIKRDSSEKFEILKKNNVTYMSDYSTNDIYFQYKDVNVARIKEGLEGLEKGEQNRILNEDTTLFLPNPNHIKIKLSYEVEKEKNPYTNQYEGNIIVEYIDKNNKEHRVIWNDDKELKTHNIDINKLSFHDVNEDNVIDTNEGLDERLRTIDSCEQRFRSALSNANVYANTSPIVIKSELLTNFNNLINSLLDAPQKSIYTDSKIIDDIIDDIDNYRTLVEKAPEKKREILSKKYGLQDKN